MTINKGFLNRKYELQPTNLMGGFFLWCLSAFILYAFFQLYRETFRIFTGQLGDRALLVLTPTENFMYNLFFASIASALGFLISQRFTLQNALSQHDGRTKSLIRTALNFEGFYTWSFLLWFGKLGSLLGIWYITSSMQYDLDFIKEVPLLLILLPLVIFYSSWPNFSRMIRQKRAWWFLRLTGLFLLMSMGFAFIDFTDYKKINKNFLSFSIEHTFDLQKPVSQSQERINRMSLATDIYIVWDTLEKETPVIFFHNIDNRVDLHNIQKAVTLARDYQATFEHDQLIANLHIDERLTMGHIKPLLNELRKAGLIQIQYSTGRKYSRYPKDYPSFKYLGIQNTLLPKYFPEFEKFLDSAEQISMKNKVIRLSESVMYRNHEILNYNRIEVKVWPDSILLNDQKISLHDLEQKVYGFIKKYAPNYVIILNTNDEVTYKRYIEVLDILWTQTDRLRNELSYELYNESFNFRYWTPAKNSIRKRFSRNVIEWSNEEQRLDALIKKSSIMNKDKQVKSVL